MEFRILGPLEVFDEGRELPLGPAKEQAVLAVLLLHPGSVVSRTQLIDGLWGESPPPTATKAVNVYVSQLRKTLTRNGGESIVTRPPGYMLAVDAEAVDATHFQSLATAARERERVGELEAASALMCEALELWRGAALAGVELEGDSRNDVSRLEELRLAAGRDLIDYELGLGRHEQIVPELERLVAQHPLDERLRGQLILALYRSGRQADALEAYRTTREALVEQLGIEPGEPLQRLERAILNHDPALEVPAGVARKGGPQPTARTARRRWIAGAAIAAACVIAVGTAAGFGLFESSAGPSDLGANALGVIDGDHATLLSKVALPGHPVALAVDGDTLWFTTRVGALVRADGAHLGRLESLVVGSHPGALALADGSVWLLEPERGTLDRIDPSTQRVVKTVQVGNGPTAVASGFGSLWVANELDGTVTRVDTATGKPVRTFPIGQAPDGVAVGAGSVWVTDVVAGVVLRVQPTNGEIVASIDVGSAPGELAFRDGSLWVANRDDGTVSRIDPRTNSVQATIPVGRSADAVALAGRSAWAISSTDDSLVQIDTATNHVVTTSRLGGAPAALAGEGRRLAVATVGTAATHRGGTLRLTGADTALAPITLDPATWWSAAGWSLFAVTNDGLLTVRRTGGSSGLQIVPDLARAKPVIGQGGKSYTFQLRSGIRYSNGRPVRPSDVRASIERLWRFGLHSPATATPELRLGLVGEARCARTPQRCDLSRGILTDDAADTVKFRLAKPNALFQRLLTLPFYDVLPTGTPARDGHPLPATGPYRITRFVPGRLLQAERNPRFTVWSTAAQPPGYPDRIVWRFEDDDAKALARVLDGRADYSVSGVPAASLAPVAERHAAQLQNEPFVFVRYLFLNTRVPPFDNADARRALNLAIDRRRIGELGGGRLAARPTCQILPPSFTGYRAWCPYTIHPNPGGSWIGPDLDGARRLVRKSGTLGTRVVLWTDARPDRVAIGRYVTGILRTLGYRATLRARPFGNPYYGYVADSRNRAQIGVAAWGPDIDDPAGYFEPLFTCAAFVPGSTMNANYSGYCDRRTDAAIRRAKMLSATDPAAANRLWAAIDRRIVAAAPWVPLYSDRWNDVLSKRVGNYLFNPMLNFLIDQAWVK